jgi:hypothetical protein
MVKCFLSSCTSKTPVRNDLDILHVINSYWTEAAYVRAPPEGFVLARAPCNKLDEIAHFLDLAGEFLGVTTRVRSLSPSIMVSNEPWTCCSLNRKVHYNKVLYNKVHYNKVHCNKVRNNKTRLYAGASQTMESNLWCPDTACDTATPGVTRLECFHRVAVLDGGLVAWCAGGFPLQMTIPSETADKGMSLAAAAPPAAELQNKKSGNP